MIEPVKISTSNGQVLVLVMGDKDELTLRVQDGKGHNRAVAKITEAQGRQLWNNLGGWLAR